MAKPNKHRRKLNRTNATRQDMTEVHATIEEERRPLVGHEENYEITRIGDVFSKRLGRFIKHKFYDFGDEFSTYIEFTVKGVKTKIGVGRAVADSYLSKTDVQAIVEQIPPEMNSMLLLKKSDLTDRLSKEYSLTGRAIFTVLVDAIKNR